MTLSRHFFQFCTDKEVSKKDLYPTFARTKHHDSSISKSVVSLLNKFGWKKVTFIYSDQIESVADTVAEVSVRKLESDTSEVITYYVRNFIRSHISEVTSYVITYEISYEITSEVSLSSFGTSAPSIEIQPYWHAILSKQWLKSVWKLALHHHLKLQTLHTNYFLYFIVWPLTDNVTEHKRRNINVNNWECDCKSV